MTKNERALRKVLREVEESLRPCERMPMVDPQHGAEIAALGERIGFGALMSSASASWRVTLATRGWPVGGEFTPGPCQATADRLLRLTRDVLKKTKSAR